MARSVVLIMLLSTVVSSESDDWYEYGTRCDMLISKQNTNKCNCSEIEGNMYDWKFYLECPAGAKMNFTFSSLTTFDTVSLDCTGLDHMSRLMDDLTSLHIGDVTYFKLYRCPLSNVSIKEIMVNAAINKVIDLEVVGNNNFSYQKKNFEKLADIAWLKISNSNLTNLPVDLFEGMDGLPNWVALDLSYNKIKTIIPGCFNEKKKIKSLSLNGNEIASLPQGFLSKNIYIQEFRMEANKIEIITLPQGFLSHLPNLETVDLTGSKVMALPEDSFWGSTSIRNLVLMRNLITNLSENTFRDLIKLEYLDLSENDITHLPEGLFNNTIALQHLDLSENNIVHLPEGLFNNTIALQHLDLSENNIVHLPEGLFNNTIALHRLDLSENNITHLQEGLFNNTTALYNLKLNNNQIKELPIGLFSSLSKLRYLYLGLNQIQKIDGDNFLNLQKLCYLDISNNKLFSLTYDNYLLRLDELILSHNYLTELLSDWLLIKRVDLSFNNIQYCEISNRYNIPESYYGTSTINLTNNRIKKIDFDIDYYGFVPGGIEPIKTFHYIDFYLNNNPFTCDCHIFEFFQFLRGQMLRQNQYLFITIGDKGELKCGGPRQLSNMHLANLTSTSLTCDLSYLENSTCPNSCSCEYRPIDKGSIITCRDAGLTQLPEQLFLNDKANHTELNIHGNNLHRLQIPFSDEYKNVTHLRLSNNNIADIHFAEELAAKLELLDLSNNKLSELSAETIQFITSAANLRTIYLHGNPWKCDCDAISMKKLLLEKNLQIRDIKKVTCPDGKPLLESDLCPPPIFAIVGVMLIACMLIVTLTVFYYKYQQQIRIYCFSSRWKVLRWMVSRPDADEGKKFDAFISYAFPDEPFVLEHLVPYLEVNGETKFKLCLHFRDWMPGESIQLQILKSIKESRRTIVVLSPSYLVSDWGRMEFSAAYDEALQDGKTRVVVILYQDVGPVDELEERIRIHLQMNTYLKWESRWFWQQLSFAMPHPSEDDDIRCVFRRRSNRRQNNDYLAISKGEMLSMNTVRSKDQYID